MSQQSLAGVVPATQLREAIHRDGFVVVRQIVSGARLITLRTACRETVQMARAGRWPFLRTLPKPFPPWPNDPALGMWGVQHLLHPLMPHRTVFAESYCDDVIAHVVRALLEVDSDAELTMELYNLLIRPDRDFALPWHRDDIRFDASEAEEAAQLADHAPHTQWNLALYEDRSLQVVPDTHRRPRTAAERSADPSGPMPGQRAVHLQPGDAVFYNNNILHRGVYDSTVERMTLHGSMGRCGIACAARARNVLQHGVGSWIRDASFEDITSPHVRQRARGLQQQLVAMGERYGNVGYSHV